MSDSFVHLHNHTQFSLLDGAQKLPILFKKIEEEGMPAIAMSDHGNMFGAYEFFQMAKKSPRQADHRHRGVSSPRTPASTGSRSSGGPAASGRCRTTARAARTSPAAAATPT